LRYYNTPFAINTTGEEECAKMEVFKLIAEVGFPIAAAMAAGYFVFLAVKFILGTVEGSIKSMKGIISSLDNRVQTMNHDVIRIDTLMSSAFGVRPDMDRIARADGKNDARKD
jgi:archaellum biogenesis ATPase FlaH|tara:strand:+ start:84 stop:422 length:339 start_codon:yes stop_codon:yes gene_type:complete